MVLVRTKTGDLWVFEVNNQIGLTAGYSWSNNRYLKLTIKGMNNQTVTQKIRIESSDLTSFYDYCGYFIGAVACVVVVLIGLRCFRWLDFRDNESRQDNLSLQVYFKDSKSLKSVKLTNEEESLDQDPFCRRTPRATFIEFKSFV